MKKTVIICIYMFLLLSGALVGLAKEETAQQSENEPVVIPDEAIRLRILANSDRDEDQELKRRIRDAVNKEITTWVKDITSIEEARRLIRSKLPEIKEIAKETMEKEGASQSISVDFDKISFPTKLYGSMVYPAGEYEAILITLGNGEGANWWCVLFPPLCFLDFSNGEAVKEQEDKEASKKQTEKALEDLTAKAEKAEKEDEKEKEDDTEVKFFVVEWFSDLFS
ncbi:stage II sporulation protein R [Bacillus mojavensis]|jgi:stage II sporulation protein R|uniref:Stage II sporulation protein R n=1 Tax=Bacillus mojavensis TaxID=72360 RepID=A0AAP3FZU2_BACMO|nr:stage II sporulation protein R [Bacillus mojavensis]MCY8105234.1 stage II sporulation protein R [Bacillus mojavensis]MCY8482558.1 stage II sporulation protein R [Bacillus mojavensis]MCY8510865.1 stage II sporulation protein R [Bacillus mojavensis]MCY9089925.1 stage II sporulation protein R [Bacillus mojavensis]MCY9187972.1 stage II sporulation protein R [Bacillus mojavensis]